MAASNASKISKALSKIAPPSVGSPKKSILPIPPRAQATTDFVLKKQTKMPKQLVSKAVKELETVKPKRLGSNIAKEVKATLGVPTPERRPPSLPLSPWNGDHSEIVKSTSNTGTAVGGAKKKVPTLKQHQTISAKVNKSAASKKTVPSNATRKSPLINTAKSVLKDGLNNTTTRPRNVPATVSKKATASSNIRGQMQTPTPVKPLKPTFVVKVVSMMTPPEHMESSSSLNDTASSILPNFRDFKEESLEITRRIDALKEELRSICHINRFSKPPPENDVKEDNITPSDPLNTSETKDKENKSECKALNASKCNTYVNLNEISPTTSVAIETPNKYGTISEPNDLGVGAGVQNDLSPFTAFPMGNLNNTFGSQTDDRTPRVRSRRSLDSISSQRGFAEEKPWSPFGQPLPRVFERQYDNVADAIFAPYVTDEEDATGGMRSPRYSY